MDWGKIESLTVEESGMVYTNNLWNKNRPSRHRFIVQSRMLSEKPCGLFPACQVPPYDEEFRPGLKGEV
ncbi:hypothetical protein P7H21_21560 [Paenibacillus larvae]|nr:hypothetical protein [Paenibacillus larvae]MDT2306001.1 hypothetical protein [Paenibacillus larvae]